MIRLHSVLKQYYDTTILNIPSTELKDRLIWLKGENGSGKTTLLKMIGGLVPFEGEITIDSTGLKSEPLRYRQLVNYVEAEPLYPPFLTGLDLIHFHQKVRGGNLEQTQALIEQLNIGAFYKNKVGTYSSGMVKRLSLVQVFIGNPKLILLDEPLVTLDGVSQQVLYEMISERVNQGTQLIFTSHQRPESAHIPSLREWKIQNHQLCAG